MPRVTDRFVLNTALLLYYELLIANEGQPNASLIARFVQNNIPGTKTTRDTIVDWMRKERWEDSIALVQKWEGADDEVTTDDDELYTSIDELAGDFSALFKDAVKMAKRAVKQSRHMKPKSFDAAHKRVIETLKMLIELKNDPRMSPQAAEAMGVWFAEALCEAGGDDTEFVEKLKAYLPLTQKILSERVHENVYLSRQSKAISAGRADEGIPE